MEILVFTNKNKSLYKINNILDYQDLCNYIRSLSPTEGLLHYFVEDKVRKIRHLYVRDYELYEIKAVGEILGYTFRIEVV